MTGTTGRGPHVVVTGPMGVGKSTTADALGVALGREVRDSDRDIESTFGCTGADLVAAHGVDELHRIESAMLLGALASPTPLVVAAAGWVIEDPRCREALRNRAITIVLAAPRAELVRRSATGAHRRPLPAEEFDAQNERRRRWYAELAWAEVDAAMPVDQIVESITSSIADAVDGSAGPS